LSSAVYALTRICSVEYTKTMESAFAIIAEPNRRAILSLLVLSQQSVGEIERRLRMPQPTVSKHLRVLRDAGFVESTVDAQRRRRAVDADPDPARRGRARAGNPGPRRAVRAVLAQTGRYQPDGLGRRDGAAVGLRGLRPVRVGGQMIDREQYTPGPASVARVL